MRLWLEAAADASSLETQAHGKQELIFPWYILPVTCRFLFPEVRLWFSCSHQVLPFSSRVPVKPQSSHRGKITLDVNFTSKIHFTQFVVASFLSKQSHFLCCAVRLIILNLFAQPCICHLLFPKYKMIWILLYLAALPNYSSFVFILFQFSIICKVEIMFSYHN